MEKIILSKGLNCTVVANKVCVIDIIRSGKATINNHDKSFGGFGKVKKVKLKVSRTEREVMKTLRKDKSVKMPPADKGNTTVFMYTKGFQKKIDDILQK